MKARILVTSLTFTVASLFALSCDSGSDEDGAGASGTAGSSTSGRGGGNSGGSNTGGSSSGGSSGTGSGASTSMAGSDDPGAGGTASGGSGGTGVSGDPCSAPGLVWKSARKTNFESYPDPGSEECIEYNGCTWAGQFAFCDGTKPEDWVSAHDIAAVFPADGLELHNLCIRSGSTTMVVTALDTCGDEDCSGCCTENRGDADRLIDLEKYTNERWGLEDGEIEWADLGENPSACD
ncbi:MAG TPA: hypothetical protein VM686_30610 [Polyangiaceae bacterium]|nr:hypothetical protein [Polyangiaceae bacterium]